MPGRSAACEPCRISKVACDHEHPVCARCRKNERAEQCGYRDRPFKKRRTLADDRVIADGGSRISAVTSLARVGTPARTYPNPGYLGASSHVEIFEHLSQVKDGNSTGTVPEVPPSLVRNPRRPFNDAQISRGARLLAEIRSLGQTDHLLRLIGNWLATGVNLALAEPFTRRCVDAFAALIQSDAVDDRSLAEDLLKTSCQPIFFDASTTLDQLFGSKNPRWEALGLVFVTISRAANLQTQYMPLYDNKEERRRLQHLAMHFADQCLELALSLDCLNDLQLILQYENFIAHSYLDGDQSYHSYRRLGDVVSSLYTLGYHQRLDDNGKSPTLLRNLRRAAFARAYSADKNVSIFLGRPPRIHRAYCQPELSRYFEFEHDERAQVDVTGSQTSQWSQDFTYYVETQWSAKCAVLKERILEISSQLQFNDRATLVNNIKSDADAQWQSLPANFRLETTLRMCDRKPIERDFMVSARLNYLHLLFLLRLTILQRRTEPDDELISVSAEILSLAVESVILRHQLANSGTSVVWRLAYYGIPAAGIICLCLMSHSSSIGNGNASIAAVIQDLNVLVAQIETGSLVDFGDPIFALLAEAARTIKTLLGKFVAGNMWHSSGRPTEAPPAQAASTLNGYDWVPWGADQEMRDFDLDFFELDFWANLPMLGGSNAEAS